jgi:hypothetical protein
MKKATQKQLEAFHALHDEFVHAVRDLRVAQYAADGMAAAVLAELRVPAGYSVDWWGDGGVKPADKCTPPPKV